MRIALLAALALTACQVDTASIDTNGHDPAARQTTFPGQGHGVADGFPGGGASADHAAVYDDECVLPTTCDEANDALADEHLVISACDTDADCGVVLEDTACSYHHNIVASNDADLTCWDALSAAAYDTCGGTPSYFWSTCEYRFWDGEICDGGMCVVNVTDYP